MRFDFDSETRRRLGYRLIDQIDSFFSSLPDRAVQLPLEQRTYGPLHDALPERGEDAERVLDELCREMVEKGFHVPSANYFGLMNPTPTYMGVLAEALVAGLNPQLATLARSQLASKIELETMRWIGERVGWPGRIQRDFHQRRQRSQFQRPGVGAGVQISRSGGRRRGRDRRPAGLVRIGRVASFARQVCGLAGNRTQGAASDRSKRSGATRSAKRWKQAIAQDHAAGRKPFCVVATAGTTNSGTVDDLVAISEICREHQLWLHVDGAYGAWRSFPTSTATWYKGIEQADSLTVDPHKWMAMPFAAGVILTNHPEILERAFSVAAPYMPKAAGAHLPDNSRISTQWTRRMNSLKLWLTLRVHGRQAYEELIDRQLRLSKSFVDVGKGFRRFRVGRSAHASDRHLPAQVGWPQSAAAGRRPRRYRG